VGSTAPGAAAGPADVANRPAHEAGVVAHELGHIWFKAWYEAERPRQPGERHYGSTAPDWLDETAAILNENDYLTAQRRSGLADLLDGEGPGPRPVSEFLTMTHPTATGARTAASSTLPRAPSSGRTVPSGSTRTTCRPVSPGGQTAASRFGGRPGLPVVQGFPPVGAR
jgi:hypothetical protein